MNYESIFFGIHPHRISVLQLPDEEAAILEYLKTKVTHVVDYDVPKVKDFFHVLSQYPRLGAPFKFHNTSGDTLLFTNHDHIIIEKSKFWSLLNHLSDGDSLSSVKFENDPASNFEITWDLDYEKYRIKGFEEYGGKMIFITKLPPETIHRKLVDRNCYFSSEMIQAFGEID